MPYLWASEELPHDRCFPSGSLSLSLIRQGGGEAKGGSC